MKPPLLVYGNCQGNWLANALQADPEIQAGYEVHYLANFGTPDPSHPALAADFWKRQPVLIRQVADNPLKLFEDFIPAGCRQWRFPMLWGKFLWPFHAPDPRNTVTAGLPFGRFFYGDRLVLAWLEAGLNPAEILERYLSEDLGKHINLGRYWEICLAEMKHLDKLSDVAVAPLVEKEFRRRRLFATSLHPTHLLLNHLLRQAKAWTLNQAAPAPAAFADDQDGEILGEEEIPVHPQIIAEFQLAWAPPDLKYRYRSRLLTFPEYLEAYIRFDLIPTGTTPQLLLERADQAYRHQQIAEAQRLLYQGLAQFPDEPLLVQPLATLLTESREFLKANYVLGCALARPGLEPALRAPWVNHLGITQYYLGNFAQAEASFREALQLQPGWVEAADNLQEVLKNRVI